MKAREFTADGARELIFQWVRQIVAASPGRTVKERQRKAAQRLRIPVGRFRDLYEGAAHRVDIHEGWIVQYHRNELARAAAEADKRYRAIRAELVDNAPALVARLAPPDPDIPTPRSRRRR